VFEVGGDELEQAGLLARRLAGHERAEAMDVALRSALQGSWG
jgi:hypothetical protein